MKIFLCLGFFYAFNLFADDLKQEFKLSDVKELRLSVSKGDISIGANKSRKEYLIIVSEKNKNPKCKKELRLENGSLIAKVESENVLFEKANCLGEIKIETPSLAVADLYISAGTAQVNIAAIAGNIDYQSGAGGLFIEGDLLKNIKIKSASLTSVINYKKCDKRADIDLMTATGDVKVYLPSECKIRVNHKSATGELFNELGDSTDYQVLINSKSANGDLRIFKRK